MLNELSKEISEINASNGWNVTVEADWNDTYKVPAILALIHSEVSEALEAFRENNCEGFAEELADIVIRVLDCAAGLAIDMDEQVHVKLLTNRTRGFKHGNKRV